MSEYVGENFSILAEGGDESVVKIFRSVDDIKIRVLSPNDTVVIGGVWKQTNKHNLIVFFLPVFECAFRRIIGKNSINIGCLIKGQRKQWQFAGAYIVSEKANERHHLFNHRGVTTLAGECCFFIIGCVLLGLLVF